MADVRLACEPNVTIGASEEQGEVTPLSGSPSPDRTETTDGLPQELRSSADAETMGDETADGAVLDTAPSDGSAAFRRPTVPADGVASRVLRRVESLLQIVDRRAHLLLSRGLTPTEAAEIVSAGEAMAVLFGRIGHPELARLARNLADIFGGDGPWGPTTAIEVAATCEDLRALLDSAIGQFEATADRGGLVVVIGEPTEEVDALCWVAHTRGHAIVHAEASIPTTIREPVAIVVVADGGFTPSIRGLLLAVGERWASPLIVLHRGAEWSTIRRLARYASVVLPLDFPPGEVVDELSRMVTAGRFQPVALLCGKVPIEAERRLSAHGFAVARVDDPDRLPEAIGSSPGVVVLGPAMGAMAASGTAHLIRADPAARHNPIVWIDGLAGPVLPARLDVATVDELDDAMAARLGAQLRRRAGDISEVGNVGNRILEWAAAEVLIDRALVAAHRTGRQVALATIRLDPLLDAERIADLAEVLGNEFRLDDILGRQGDRILVLALGGVPRMVAVRRLTSLLTRLGLGDGAARVGVALFPSDGRSAIDLVGAAHGAAKRAADNDGPAVVATTWRPESDEVDVMVVDADPVLSQVVVDLLKGSGLRSLPCESGPEALAALRADDRRVTPRLLLLDLDVRGIDGLGMLRELRTAGLLSQMKVLLMMARFSEADLRVALDIGAADVISKPLSATLLLHRIRLLLGEGA